MLWTQTTPNQLLTFDQLSWHLRLDPDTAADPNEIDYVNDLIVAATDYAENSLSASLLTRTVTATFFLGDKIILPRGPVQSITTVTDNGNTLSTTQFLWTRVGNTDLMAVPNGWQGPLVVVYQSGFGDDPTTVPGDIRQAIRVHVGTMYENRESVSDKTMVVVPHSLELFYQKRNRTSYVG
jgi:uncharacterized phiE125 gp8 family phage protein